MHPNTSFNSLKNDKRRYFARCEFFYRTRKSGEKQEQSNFSNFFQFYNPTIGDFLFHLYLIFWHSNILSTKYFLRPFWASYRSHKVCAKDKNNTSETTKVFFLINATKKSGTLTSSFLKKLSLKAERSKLSIVQRDHFVASLSVRIFILFCSVIHICYLPAGRSVW